MNKIYKRILLSLVSVITVLGFFSAILINASNAVRVEHYWSDLISPILGFSELETLIQKDSLPNSISTELYSDSGLSALTQERLASSQVVVSVDDKEIVAWVLKNGQVIELQSDLSGDAVYEMYRWIVFQELTMQVEGRDVDELILSLESTLPITISKVLDSEKLSSQRLLNELADRGFHIYITDSKVHCLMQLGDGSLYEIQFPQLYSELSWPIILFLIVSVIVTLLMIAYSLVRGFDRRLRNIEAAASRISRGELDARVTRTGSEDSIGRLGAAFNSMADHIQRLMYVQKEMIHAVSHELRTPVARIRFGVQMIEDCPTQDELQKQIVGIDGDIQELDELIDEILTYARLEQGGPILAFQEADVGAIVEQVVSEQSSVKPEMKIFSEYKKGSDLWKISEVEARYIHRSIQNLVGNATRYAQGKVKVMCSFDAETCRVDVEDDGPGIPEEDWESVFTPFARLDDSRTRSSGGYGLGLSIVRRILYWHGGQAFLGRSEMGGAKFSLVWPRKQLEV